MKVSKKDVMTPEEKYINFMLNYNKKLKERNTDWLEPQDFGDVILETVEQNEPGCLEKILENYEHIERNVNND